MDRREKELYHQIHPLKLSTDWTCGLVALYFLWRHRLRSALAVALAPGILVSWTLIRWADLEPYKRSRFGRYVNRCMTRRMEDIRLLGYAVMVMGAWFWRPTLLPGGLLIILFGWLKGKFFSWHLLTNTEEITPEEWQRQPLAELTERTLAALTTSVRRGPQGFVAHLYNSGVRVAESRR